MPDLGAAHVSEVWRVFEYDYVYFDAVLLFVWLSTLATLRERAAITFGIIIAPLIYGVDAGIWWNTPVDTQDGVTVYLREYWIGGQQVPHPMGEFGLRKFGADFMMTLSYAMYAFPWLWIAFRGVSDRCYRRAVGLGGLWAVLWSLLPLLSQWVDIDNTEVRAVRHMGETYYWWAAATAFGYGLLAVVYRRRLRTVAEVFAIGAFGALVMEIPLHVSGIRPFDPWFIALEAAILLNQAVPYLYLLVDRLILPRLRSPERT